MTIVAPWLTKSRPRLLVALKVAFLENYLVVRTWILNESSIECHEKKHQPFSLVIWRFKFLGENLLGAGAVENKLSALDFFLY